MQNRGGCKGGRGKRGGGGRGGRGRGREGGHEDTFLGRKHAHVGTSVPAQHALVVALLVFREDHARLVLLCQFLRHLQALARAQGEGLILLAYRSQLIIE